MLPKTTRQFSLILFVAVFAAILSIAAASPQNSCKDLADFVQQSSKLPTKPDEDGKVTRISGSEAKKMFPGRAKDLSIWKDYVFASYFNTCTREPSYMQAAVKSGPYEEKETKTTAYNLGADLGFDLSLATVWKYLPKTAVKAGITRGYEKVTVSGVSVPAGQLKQQCIVTPGWYCTGYIRLDEFKSGKVIVDDRIREPTFFPASLNGK
ncbi:hypothetical protein EC973_008013, partial [Apophysomyces ossiformis]